MDLSKGDRYCNGTADALRTWDFEAAWEEVSLPKQYGSLVEEVTISPVGGERSWQETLFQIGKHCRG